MSVTSAVTKNCKTLLKFGLIAVIVVFLLNFVVSSSFVIRKLNVIAARVEPLHHDSVIPFSTAGAVICRRTPKSSDDSDREFCRSLLGGDNQQRIDDQTMVDQTVHWWPSTLDDYVECTANCTHFRSEFGYWTSVADISQEELEFPLAFRYLLADSTKYLSTWKI